MKEELEKVPFSCSTRYRNELYKKKKKEKNNWKQLYKEALELNKKQLIIRRNEGKLPITRKYSYDKNLYCLEYHPNPQCLKYYYPEKSSTEINNIVTDNWRTFIFIYATTTLSAVRQVEKEYTTDKSEFNTNRKSIEINGLKGYCVSGFHMVKDIPQWFKEDNTYYGTKIVWFEKSLTWYNIIPQINILKSIQIDPDYVSLSTPKAVLDKIKRTRKKLDQDYKKKKIKSKKSYFKVIQPTDRMICIVNSDATQYKRIWLSEKETTYSDWKFTSKTAYKKHIPYPKDKILNNPISKTRLYRISLEIKRKERQDELVKKLQLAKTIQK